MTRINKRKVALTLRDLRDSLDCTCDDGEDPCCIDVRLQAVDGGWFLHSGPSDYDQDHRGAWGAGCISPHDSDADLRWLADDLVEQARDMEQ